MAATTLIAAVRKGRDRQEVHEALRKHSMAAAQRVKSMGLPNDLIERLHSEPLLVGVNLDELLNPAAYVGRAPEQVALFLNQIVKSVRNAYGTKFSQLSPSEPRV